MSKKTQTETKKKSKASSSSSHGGEWLQGPRGGQYKLQRTAGGEERKVYKKENVERKAGGSEMMMTPKKNQEAKRRGGARSGSRRSMSRSRSRSRSPGGRHGGHWRGGRYSYGRGGFYPGYGAAAATGLLAGAALGAYPYATRYSSSCPPGYWFDGVYCRPL